MKTEYSHALLYFFICRNNQRAESISAVATVCLRLKRLYSLIKQYLTYPSSLITILSGDAVRYGAGAFTLTSPSKRQVLRLLWQSKFDLGALPPCRGVSFLECLKIERDFDDSHTVRYNLTLHQILMVEYSQQRQRLLLKVTATPNGNAYLQRQAVGLSNNPYIIALEQMNMSTPSLIASELNKDQQALLQTYVVGEVFSGGKQRREFIEVLIQCIEVTLLVNEKFSRVPITWDAYADFALLPHYFKMGRKLDEVVDYINRWLGALSTKPTYIHGDYHLGNIILEPGQHKIRGMIDFDRTCAGGLPLHDALMLLLTDVSEQHRFLGESVSAVLADEDPDGSYRPVLNKLCELSGLSLSDVQHISIVVWLFVLQSAMREKLKYNRNWQRIMIEQVTDDAHRFCTQQEQV